MIEPGYAPRLSLSAVSVYDIRYSRPRASETPADHVTRLAMTYALDLAAVRLMRTVGDADIDAIGRIRA